MNNYEKVKRTAEQDFAEHKLTRLSKAGDFVEAYLCSKSYDNGDFNSTFHFYVVSFGCYLSIYGDIGTMTLRNHGSMIGWLRNAIKSPDYLFEKLHNDGHDLKEFSLARFKEWIDEEAKDEDSLLEAENLSDLIGTAQDGGDVIAALMNELIELGYADVFELADCWQEYTKRTWLRYFALKKFIELYDAQDMSKQRSDFNEVMAAINANNIEKGFAVNPEPESIRTALFLVIEEVIEAGRYTRETNFNPCLSTTETDVTGNSKPEGFGVELADAVMRLMGIAAQLNIDLLSLLLEKLEYNKTRPYMHGKSC